MKRLTQIRLKELIDYNPDTGVFFWKKARGCAQKDSLCGSISKSDGYRYIRVDTKSYTASRLAHLYMNGYFPEHEMDHINRVRGDNRWCNLRHVTHQCNVRNSGIRKDNMSGITGIWWDKNRNKWYVRIDVSGKTIHIGRYENKKDAAKARWDAEVKYNFPNCNTTSSAYKYLKEKDLL